jgi:2'-5' RNA ligase
MPLDAPHLADHWWWRPGWQVGSRYFSWHVTLEDQPELRRYAARYQQALRPFAALDVVPEPWLHITMQGVGHVAEVPERQRDAVVSAVRRRLADLPPAPITFGRPVVHREAVAVNALDPEPLRRVRRAVRAGIAEALGPRSVAGSDEDYSPHFSLAYANSSADATGIPAALDAVAVPPVTTTVRRVALIEMHRDDRMYEWRTVEQVRLGGR